MLCRPPSLGILDVVVERLLSRSQLVIEVRKLGLLDLEYRPDPNVARGPRAAGHLAGDLRLLVLDLLSDLIHKALRLAYGGIPGHVDCRRRQG